MAPGPPSDDAAKTLALAVITASRAPLLLLDEEMKVVAASDSFLDSYGFSAADVSGQCLFDLGAGEWDMPRLRSVLSDVASGGDAVEGCEIDLLEPDGRRRNLVVEAHQLAASEAPRLRIMLTLVDDTAARAAAKFKDDLIRDKDILLQEIRHRVANSLQIIASLLIQNARTVSSEESRTLLRDAHLRVMSVASVQSQLMTSSDSDVTITPYLEKLCQSIGASMIEDGDRISIVVNGDGSATSGEMSVKLGLIVTELVVNALKYAFPDERPGHVSVDYHSENDGWALSVCDDGVGMSARHDRAHTGLGTAIVKALAAQLSATVTVSDLAPGTGVSVVRPDRTGLSKGADSRARRTG